MAVKTKDAKNSDRRNGKAWGKDHNAPVEPKSEETKAHEAHRKARRGPSKGPAITLPKITWEWAGSVMAARWPNTRKARTFNAWLAQGGRSVIVDEYPTTIESNPEARRNGR